MNGLRREGFVLLEAVVALAILGMASIVLLQVRAQQIRVATQARELLTAQALAEDRLAALRMLDYELLADPPDSLTEGVFPPPFEGFRWTATVALMEEEYDLFGVEVEVTGPEERFPLRTMLHRARGMLAVGDGGVGGGAIGGAGGRGGMDGRGSMGGDRGGRGGNPGGGTGGGTGGAGVRLPGRGGSSGMRTNPGGGGW